MVVVVVIVAVVLCQSARNELKINEEKKQKTMDKKYTFESDEKIRKRKRPWNEVIGELAIRLTNKIYRDRED